MGVPVHEQPETPHARQTEGGGDPRFIPPRGSRLWVLLSKDMEEPSGTKNAGPVDAPGLGKSVDARGLVAGFDALEDQGPEPAPAGGYPPPGVFGSALVPHAPRQNGPEPFYGVWSGAAATCPRLGLFLSALGVVRRVVPYGHAVEPESAPGYAVGFLPLAFRQAPGLPEALARLGQGRPDALAQLGVDRRVVGPGRPGGQ